MAPRKSTAAKKNQLLTGAGSMKSLGQWIQQSTESLMGATHPLMEQVRSAFPAGGNNELCPGPEVEPVQQRQRRTSQVESASLAAALRNRGGAPTKKATTPPGGSSPQQPQSRRHRRASAPVQPAGSPSATADFLGGAMGPVRSSPVAAVPPLQLDRGLREKHGHGHRQMSSRGEVKLTGANGLVAHLDEFIRRGTPRAVPPTGGSRMPAARLEQRLASWARSRGLPPSAGPRLVSPELTALQRTGDGSVLAPTAREATMLWRGVGIDLLLEGGVAASAPSGEAQESWRVVSAHTDCGWADARLGIAMATEKAAGLPIEAFLDALWQAWQQQQQGCLAPAPDTPGRSTGVSSSKGLERHRRATVGGETCLSPERSSGAMGNSPCSESSSFASSSTRSCTEVGPQNREMGLAGLGGETCDEGFADWLAARPPLWRFDQSSRGLAWDFPPSKAERRELMLLTLFAEDGERQAQIADFRGALPNAPAGTKGA